jgi:hypothetical protein
MNGRETDRIRIYQKGNGLVQVDPSPAILRSGQTVAIVNTTDEEAVIGFDPAYISPSQPVVAEKREMLASRARATFVAGDLADIPPHGARDFTVVTKRPSYFEYEVLLLGSGRCAEGSSKPGGIVDP